MRIPYIIGEKLYLRPLEREDLTETYLGWVNDPEVNKYLEVGLFPTNRDDLASYYERTHHPSSIVLAIVDKASDQHIGNISLTSINYIHGRADLGIMIGRKNFWRKGYGTEAIKLVVDYAFKRLRLHKISAGMYEENQASRWVFEKAGFIFVACLVDELYREGSYHSKVVMKKLNKEVMK